MSPIEKHSDEKALPGYVTELDDGSTSVDTLTALIVEGRAYFMYYVGCSSLLTLQCRPST